MPWAEVARLPLDFEAGKRANTNASAADVRFGLSSEETRRLLEGMKRPEHVIITALARCLAGWTSSPTVLMDVLSHGRDAALPGVNLARTVGFTLSYNPMVLSHPTWEPTPDTIASVAERIGDAPAGFGFELLRFLSPDPQLRRRLDGLPRAEVLFNYDRVGAAGRDDALWPPAAESPGRSESPRGLRQYPLAVRAWMEPNLELTFVYSTALHHPATIEAKAAEVASTLRSLLGRLPATVA